VRVTTLQGRCPACLRWFDCRDWYDDAAPLPHCPACGRAPDRLEHVVAVLPERERVVAGVGGSRRSLTSEIWVG
jgi:hypothetical protein